MSLGIKVARRRRGREWSFKGSKEMVVRSRSSDYVLESIAADLGTTPSEIINSFIGRTRFLTPGEQAELLGAVLETAQQRPEVGARPVSQGQASARQAGGQPAARQGGQPPAQQNSQSRARQGGQPPSVGDGHPPTVGGGRAPSPRAGGAQPRSPRGGGDFFSALSQVAGGVQQGLGFFTQGAQVISSIASLFGGSTGQDVSRVAGQLSVGGSQVGALLQGLQGGRVPSLPGE